MIPVTGMSPIVIAIFSNIWNVNTEQVYHEIMDDNTPLSVKENFEKLDDIISNLTQIETFALKLKDNHSKMLGDVDQIDPLILEGALEKLESLSNTIEEMEV